MNERIFGSAGLIAAIAALAGAAASQDAQDVSPSRIPLDTESAIGNIGIACTGIGQTKDEARWKAYNVRLEFSNPSGDLLANESVRISNSAGQTLATVSCEGPWILMRAPAGTYKVDAWLPGAGMKHHTATFSPPAQGLRIVGLRFPEA